MAPSSSRPRPASPSPVEPSPAPPGAGGDVGAVLDAAVALAMRTGKRPSVEAVAVELGVPRHVVHARVGTRQSLLIGAAARHVSQQLAAPPPGRRGGRAAQVARGLERAALLGVSDPVAGWLLGPDAVALPRRDPPVATAVRDVLGAYWLRQFTAAPSADDLTWLVFAHFMLVAAMGTSDQPGGGGADVARLSTFAARSLVSAGASGA